MKELSRRMMTISEEGTTCGAYGVDAVDAEIVVEDNGTTVYLHGQWVSECPDDICFEATLESIYDYCVKLNECDDETFDTLVDEMNRVSEEGREDPFFDDIDVDEHYAEQFEEIRKMLLEGVKQLGYEI